MTEASLATEKREEFNEELDTLLECHASAEFCLGAKGGNALERKADKAKKNIVNFILKECVFKDDVRRIAEETIQEERFCGAPNGINKVVENLGLKPLERRRNRENK